MKLKFVTMTGADDSINSNELLAISKDFPFVEWGILLGKNPRIRFPSLNWITKLFQLNDNYNLNLSGHYCGNICKDIINNKDIQHGLFFNEFQRIQLNFSPYDVSLDLIQELKSENQFIFQIGKKDKSELIQEALKQKTNFGVLFDQSGGIGKSPETWPEPILNVFCGYAGGLGPDNLKEELDKISQVSGNKEIWIDAETKIRSDDNNLFDLNKVRKFLEIAADYNRDKIE